jgi:aldehyde:ferredoxin oxidoreductase
MEPDLKRVLIIDLTNQNYRVEERPELFRERLGGAGAAIRLLDEFCQTGADPIGPDNPIILAVGALTALFPLASKCVAMFKSPLTGNLGESHAGGRTAVAIRMAGYGAIVITGASDYPVFLSITEDEVVFRDARSLWGMGRGDTAARIIREFEGTPGTRTILRIGRAGENLVRYAAVTSETFRHFGRMGLGTVFGSKNLKAIVVSGSSSIPVADSKAYRALYDTMYDQVTTSSLMKKYHDIGTAVNVKPLIALGSLPIKNLTASNIDASERLSGEELASRFLPRRVACSHCPVSCIHIAQIRTPYPHDPYFFKTTPVCYDYELIYALGFMLGIVDSVSVLTLIEEIERTGLDAMSAGVVASWATEAMQHHLITPELAGGITLSFGDGESYLSFFKMLADQKLPLYRDLGKGVDHAASVYGGSEYALAFGKNEMPGYHTGPAALIGYLTGARHSHLDAAGYSIDQKPEEKSPKQIAQELYKEESWRQILSSLVVCFFARAVYTEDMVTDCLKICGIECTPAQLIELGESILKEKYAFKFREGFSLESDKLRIPKRVTELSSGRGFISESTIREGVCEYEKLIRQIQK